MDAERGCAAMDVVGLITLAEGAVVGAERIGGKAAALARLIAAGFVVPGGFVVTDDAFAVPAHAFDAAITRAARELGKGPFAVRSSAAAEDLPDASYAGLYETFLDVATGELAEAGRRCHAAPGAARVDAYQLSRTTGHTIGSGMAGVGWMREGGGGKGGVCGWGGLLKKKKYSKGRRI